MDDTKARLKMDYYKGTPPPWSLTSQHQAKAVNALDLNRKIMGILADKNNAIRERNAAIEDTKEALRARGEAIRQTNQACMERDKALMERDNAKAALIQLENGITNYSTVSGTQQRGRKREHLSPVSPSDSHLHLAPSDLPEAFEDADEPPLQVKNNSSSSKRCQTKRVKQNRGNSTRVSKGKKVEKDLNMLALPMEKRVRSKWDSREDGLNLVNYNGTIMPVPVCSCTGVPHHCYKWGNGGWQSSCCTTSISMFPLPQIPNKRHARIGGRKMSGSVFTRLVNRVAEEGHDPSVPVDLKEYWAKHGTNRYITIK